MDLDLEQYVKRAKEGDLQALEKVIYGIQERVYGLAFRMLSHKEDAEDEAQEILIRIITNLGSFREESAFSSWVYKVACNHLLTARKKRSERVHVTFDMLEKSVSSGLENAEPLTASGPERDVMLEETRVGCMQGALACLEKNVRIAFILGTHYEVSSREGGFILDITPELFRKRLSRARKSLQDFMLKNCGLVNSDNPCRCQKQAVDRLKNGLIDMTFVKKEKASKGRSEAVTHLEELDEIDRTVAMYHRYPEYYTPKSFTHVLKDLIDSGRYSVFGG